MDFDTYLRDKLLNHAFRNTAYTQPATVYLALFTDTGASVEVAGGGYARQAITFGAPVANVIANTNLVDFGAAAGAWGTIQSIAIMDAAAAGNTMGKKELPEPRVINTGDTFTMPVGNITVNLQ